MLKSCIAGVSALLFLASGALAADKPLTEDQAKRFVETLEAVEELGKEFETEGKMEEFRLATTPVAGEAFKPYSGAVASLKENHPGDHARLEKAVKPHGFSADEWAGVGDRIMVAYLAVKMEEENPQAMAQMASMDKSMLDMMPPDMQAQMAQALAMVETIKNATPEDKAAVASVREDLDAYMEKQAQL
ncbi:hypothetical protein [Hyphococcus sp.]|uniref:hypothetical protein n=1 Tax=Hyphococcus sp. TaxID=2038636 RepID=UPI003CCC1343